MSRTRPAFCLLLLTVACSAPAASDMRDADVAAELAKLRIAPGRWRLTTEVTDATGPDLPRDIRNRMIGPRNDLTTCITPAQAARPQANFLALGESRRCTYRGLEISGGRINGSMRCGPMDVRIEGRFAADSFEMRAFNGSPVPGGGTMLVTLRGAGRRLGDCTQRDTR